MHSNKFSDRLKQLMKERKISGQKIADAIGVSQKTISRYVTGEIEPNEVVQKKVLQAIADIGGHPEDAIMEKKSFVLPTTLRELIESGIELPSEEELLEADLQEFYRDKELACKVFSLLEIENQKFVLDNYDVYCNMDVYEIAIVEIFNTIPEEKREFIIESLDTFRLSLSAMKENLHICHKIASYFEMMSKCNATVQEKAEKFTDLPSKVLYSQFTDAYADKLEKSSGMDVETLGAYLPELVSFEEIDWYLLILVQMLAMRDKGANLTYNGKMVGDKVFALLNYLENMVEDKE